MHVFVFWKYSRNENYVSIDSFAGINFFLLHVRVTSFKGDKLGRAEVTDLLLLSHTILIRSVSCYPPGAVELIPEHSLLSSFIHHPAIETHAI